MARFVHYMITSQDSDSQARRPSRKNANYNVGGTLSCVAQLFTMLLRSTYVNLENRSFICREWQSSSSFSPSSSMCRDSLQIITTASAGVRLSVGLSKGVQRRQRKHAHVARPQLPTILTQSTLSLDSTRSVVSCEMNDLAARRASVINGAPGYTTGWSARHGPRSQSVSRCSYAATSPARCRRPQQPQTKLLSNPRQRRRRRPTAI